ncbi:MAG: polyphosphate polymerase domain-containing protein [Myxococcales bacterium]
MKAPDPDADLRLTRDRQELKFLVPRARAAAVIAGLDARLPRHRFAGDGSNTLPRAEHYVTTVYFDTPSGAVLDAARAGHRHAKLRARQYYDLHPDLVELALTAGEAAKSSPVLWLELKSRDGAQSGKRRVGIPRDELDSFFRDGVISERMRSIQAATHGEQADSVFEALREFREGFGEPLEAACLVQYCRIAWQPPEEILRITLDQNLKVYPRELLFEGFDPLSLMQATPIYAEPNAVLEVKSGAHWPAWLGELLREQGVEARDYSKFLVASAARGHKGRTATG